MTARHCLALAEQKPRLKSNWYQVYPLGLGSCLGDNVLIINWFKRAQTTVAVTVPWAGGPGLYKRAKQV